MPGGLRLGIAHHDSLRLPVRLVGPLGKVERKIRLVCRAAAAAQHSGQCYDRQKNTHAIPPILIRTADDRKTIIIESAGSFEPAQPTLNLRPER